MAEVEETNESVADSVRAAIAEVNTPAVEPTTPVDDTVTEAAPAPETVQDNGQPRTPDGKFAPKTVAEEVREQATKQTKAAPTKVEAPQHWPEEDKQFFNSLPDDNARSRWLDKNKKLESGYEQKFQDIASWKKATEPFREYLEGMGATPQQAVQYLLNADRMLRYGSPEQKAHAAKMLFSEYQIPLPSEAPQQPVQPGPAPEGGQIDPSKHWDPAMQHAWREISQLKSELTSRQQQEQMAEKRRIDAAVLDFANAVDDAGQLKRPHLNEVLEDLAVLIHAYEIRTGRKPPVEDLQKLYEKACYASDTVRQKLLDEQAAAAEASRQREAKARATQARNAGSSVNGAPVGGAASGMPGSKGSVREDVAHAISQVRGGRV